MLLPHFETVIITKYLENPRGVPIDELESYISTIADRPVHTVTEPYAAWKLASRLARREDQIVVTGSFFLIAELREMILDDLRHESPIEDGHATPQRDPEGASS